MSQKGISSIAVISIVAGVLLAGGGIWYLQSRISEQPFQSSIVERPITEQKSMVKQQFSDEIVNWKTYRNEKYGFEVKMPQDWQITQNDIDIRFYSAGTWADFIRLQHIPSDERAEGVSPDFTFRLDRERPNKSSVIKSMSFNSINFTTFTAIGYPEIEYLYFETIKSGKIFSFASRTNYGKEYLPKILSTFKFTK